MVLQMALPFSLDPRHLLAAVLFTVHFILATMRFLQFDTLVLGPGKQVQYAPPYGPGSGSQSGLIDPCKLFVKVR